MLTDPEENTEREDEMRGGQKWRTRQLQCAHELNSRIKRQEIESDRRAFVHCDRVLEGNIECSRLAVAWRD